MKSVEVAKYIGIPPGTFIKFIRENPDGIVRFTINTMDTEIPVLITYQRKVVQSNDM